MRRGIPYFGEQHNEIVRTISRELRKKKPYYKEETFYDIINKYAGQRVVVCIKDLNGLRFTWLHDIQMNYRDGILQLPYYDYELAERKRRRRSSLNHGHMYLINNKTYGIRYNYRLVNMPITKPTQKFLMYNLDTGEAFYIRANKWYNDEFDMTELYRNYINSAYGEDDFVFGKHLGGYHYITYTVKGFCNLELLYRRRMELPDYSDAAAPYMSDWRDVRQYRKEELFRPLDPIELTPYNIRRLKFDSQLFCIIKQRALPNDKTITDRYTKLFENNGIYVYRPAYKTPALIFKGYWFGNGQFNDKRSIRTKF